MQISTRLPTFLPAVFLSRPATTIDFAPVLPGRERSVVLAAVPGTDKPVFLQEGGASVYLT